jgi:hypothetical protein
MGFRTIEGEIDRGVRGMEREREGERERGRERERKRERERERKREKERERLDSWSEINFFRLRK